MIGLVLAAGVATNVDWRRLGLLVFALALPVPAAVLVGILWWRSRPALNMRGARFCDAISTELRAGASFRAALETAAVSVDATEMIHLCQVGASMANITVAAREEFSGIGQELGALIARPQGVGVSPAALFEEIGNLAMAQLEVEHEVSTASAAAKATGTVLLIGPVAAISLTAMRGGFDPYLAQPAQRVAAFLGLGLAGIGLLVTIVMLKGAR
jgi:hypothetical protein